MGAEQFVTRATGASASEAFSRAVEQAQYDYGHAGYTGTIAEKRGFKLVTPNGPGESPKQVVERCLEDDRHFCQDKWGDAGAVDAGPNPKNPKERIFIFFGWASS